MDRLPRQHAAPEVAAAAGQGRGSAACSIFDASLDHHFALDPEGRVLYANQAQLAHWQIARDQAIGKTLGELGYRPEVTDNLQQALRAMRINRQSLGVRMDYPGSPGVSRALETVLTPILDEAGNLVEVVGVSRDITERVHRDAALRARDARSMALVKLGDQLRTLTTPADLAFAAAQILGETLRVSRCGYATIDAVAETAIVERSWTAPGVESLPRRLHFMRDYGSFIEDLKRGELVVIADAELDPRTRDTTAALKSVSAQAVVNVPVMEEGQLVALLYLNNASARSWSPEELSFVREVADRTRRR